MQSAPVSKARIWVGRVISTLMALFLIFDGLTKVIKMPQVILASAKIGFSAGDVVAIGAVLLVSTALYVIPRTSILGAILLTGYLGGATATNVLAHTAAFNTSFPVVFGILLWLGLYLRHDGLRGLVPLQS